MKGRIVVACDDVVVARFLAQGPSSEACGADVLGDGVHSSERAMTTRPALVIVALSMPGADGVEVVRRIRANPPTSSLPVILLTDRGETQDKVLGLTAGADDYIVVPFDTLELIARINGTLRRTADIRALSP